MDRMAFSGCIYKISDRNYVLRECVTCINVQRSRSNFVIIVRLDDKIWYEKHVRTLIRFSFIRPYQLARQNSKTINKILLLLLILWTFLGWLVKGQIGPWKYLLPSLPLQTPIMPPPTRRCYSLYRNNKTFIILLFGTIDPKNDPPLVVGFILYCYYCCYC